MNRLLSRSWLVLLLLFALGLLPRIVGLTWGLPSSEHWFSFHPDERQIFEGVASLPNGQGLDPLNGDFNPNFFNYPSLFFYVTWIVNFVRGGLGFSTPADVSNPNAPWPIIRDVIFSARLACAFAGAAIAPIVFAWARRVFSARAALLAGVLAALSPGLVQHSHFATVDVPATFFVALCLFLTARAQDENEAKPRLKYLALAAFVAGLAAATKYNAVLVAVAPLCAAILMKQPLKYLGALVALPVVGFVLGCPFSVLSPSEFWGSTDANLQQGFAFELLTHPKIGSGDIFQGTGNGWAYHLTFTLPFALTAPIFVASLASLASLLRQKHEARASLNLMRPALAFAVIYFLAIGTSQVRFVRYVLPIAPVLILLAASLIDAPSLRKKAPQVLAGLLVVVSAWGARDVIYPFTQPDSRELAAAFVRENARPPLPQVVGVADAYWFSSPPLLPFNARGGPRLPQDSQDGKLRVEELGLDASKLQKQRPSWVAEGEFDWREKQRLGEPKYLQWQKFLSGGYDVAWSGKAQAPAALPGRTFVPHDFLYANPEVRIYRRR